MKRRGEAEIPREEQRRKRGRKSEETCGKKWKLDHLASAVIAETPTGCVKTGAHVTRRDQHVDITI